MEVIKRNGQIVPFDYFKIVTAIAKAVHDVDGNYGECGDLCDSIAESIAALNWDCVSVEEIQDMVEEALMDSDRKDVARAYIRYRYKRENARLAKDDFMKSIQEKLEASNVENQNANVDEKSFGGRKGEASNVLLKQFALDFCVSEMARKNHLENMIYIHDLDNYVLGDHNCLTIPFDNLLKNGFNTRQVDIRPAKSVDTAFQLVAVIFQLQSLQQFGGVAASHLDWTMVPYVKMSFRKHYLDGLKYIENIEDYPSDHIPFNAGIEDGEYKIYPKAYKYALDMTEKELSQAVEGMYHNLKYIRAT